ncbi:DUF6303 family protein [Streptomyces platensis]|uniref:DUF6303 family protein n=1 Tax=Streptomyces platensis TaxID=58346 RepID=UPI0030E0C2F8
MAETFTAQLSTGVRGSWFVYVVLYGETEWPEHDWGRSSPVPTLAERERALAALGYEVPEGAIWEWQEYTETPDDPASAVRLLAAVTVRKSGGGGAT